MAGKANPCGKIREGSMVSEHTPGPWVVKSTDEDINTKTIIDRDEFWIAKVLNFNPTSDDIRESRANANLIAAAPAMYEALKDSLVLLEASYHDMHDKFGAHDLGTLTVFDCVEKVKATLAQAEGKQ